jgi:hypothetical protein
MAWFVSDIKTPQTKRAMIDCESYGEIRRKYIREEKLRNTGSDGNTLIKH